ncbi:S8 family serine peptidase [bacterium]|nr:S8 family serine peptidase [bacterium]
MSRIRLGLIAAALLIAVTTAWSGEISPQLADRWSKLAPSQTSNGIFHLWEKVDIRELDISITQMHVTRQKRHQIVVEELQRVARESQPPVTAALDDLLRRGEITGYTAYWITNCYVIAAPHEKLAEIAKWDAFQWTEEPPQIELIGPVERAGRLPDGALDDHTPGVTAVRAPEVWYELGYTGEGALVANMDTGVDLEHPALGSRWRGNEHPHAECWLDLINNSEVPEDFGAHGTHVMGTICGTGSASAQFDTVGVAPGAQWIATNPINQGVGNEFDNDVLEGYEWFADPDGDPFTVEDVPDVVQNSWGINGGFGNPYQDCYTFWNTALLAMEAAGTVVTFSAGNEGWQGAASHRSPANIAIDSVTFFSVGAVDATNNPNPPYPIADFSSLGPSDCDPNQIKPEICAPGVDVYSCVPGNGYEMMSGTSMAGPHLAGVVALMREANPNAEVRDIKAVLLETAIDYGVDGDDNTFGRGMVDAYEACLLISADRGWVMGQVTDATSGDPIVGARVQAGANYIRFSDALGNYRISLPADSALPFTVSYFGYAQFATTMTVADSDTVFLDIEMNLVPSCQVNGTIEIGNSIPVTGATVQVMNTPLAPQTTNFDGEFSFMLPVSNTYSLHIEFQDIVNDVDLVVPNQNSMDVTYTLNSPRSQPSGPDTYGYRAYEVYDTGIAPTYDWVEIDPYRGGSGTVLSFFNLQDVSAFVEMPFPFKFYGQSYDSITVNENGWIAPGEDPDRTNQNQNIPDNRGPAGMLALYWDNLFRSSTLPDSSRISVFHDQTQRRLIVQYTNLHNLPPDQDTVVTAQAIIYDAEYWPTPTGDCEIVFQYQRVDFPNDCTVGIEEPGEVFGLEIQQNDELSASTFAVQTGTAILFTTRTTARVNGSASGTITAHPALTALIPNGVRIGDAQASVAANGSFSVTGVFSGPRFVRVQIPGYEQLLVPVTIPDGGNGVANAEVWRVDPPTQLAAAVVGDSVFLSWQAPESVGPLDQFEAYLVYENGVIRDTVDTESYRLRLFIPGEYQYVITALYTGGESIPSNSVTVVHTAADENGVALPTKFALHSAYPNPFNPSTQLRFDVPSASQVSLRIFDLTGREVATLVNGRHEPGVYHASWNASSLATGVYFARLDAGEYTLTQKLLLLK